jgi:hypothetical protein
MGALTGRVPPQIKWNGFVGLGGMVYPSQGCLVLFGCSVPFWQIWWSCPRCLSSSQQQSSWDVRNFWERSVLRTQRCCPWRLAVVPGGSDNGWGALPSWSESYLHIALLLILVVQHAQGIVCRLEKHNTLSKVNAAGTIFLAQLTWLLLSSNGCQKH